MSINELKKLGNHQVPGIWGSLLPAGFFSLDFPEEKRSNCSACPEVKDSGFRPDYRCCTFQPRIPNYMLGLALLDPAQHAAPIISKLYHDRYFLPEGLVASPKRWELFLDDASNHLFGKSTQVLCHFLNPSDGLCQIYNYRNGPCSTFFCHNDQGEAGRRFWDSLMIYINQTEHALSQWVMSQLGFDLKKYFAIFEEQSKDMKIFKSSNQGWPEDFLKTLWGKWYGKELEFFREAAALIEQNAGELMTIAEAVDLQESLGFEKASISLMSAALQDEVDQGDLVEGKSSKLSYLYKIMMLHYREMLQTRC